MSDVKLPYITWRDGRPRFNPPARVQRLGFKSEDLRAGKTGPWFTFEQTKTWAENRHTEIIAARVSGKRRAPAPATRRGGLVGELLDDWLAALKADTDPDTQLSPDSIASYVKAANAIRWKPESRTQRKKRIEKERAAVTLEIDLPARAAEPFAQASVLSIGKIELNSFFLYAKKARGLHMALSMVAAISAAWSWGELDPRWRLPANPRRGMLFARPEGRIVIHSDLEIRALVAAADATDRASIGDSIYLGLMSAQRQRDRIFLKDEGMIDGRRHFRQSKTGKLVPVRETPQLAARLEAARARVAAIKLKLGTRPETVIVDETTGNTYNQDTYRHSFAEVRALAIKGSNEYGLAPCPSLAGKRDQDLRDTAVTWLARAGCTLLEICAISGHSPRSVQTIIKHYLGSQAELADSGIDKLVAWMKREGIAV
jgi:hypothetical protein